MAEKKEKRYVSDNARLMAEWHPTKNFPLTPNTVTYGSTKQIWWKCKYGHEWQATANNRSTGYGCPYCSGRKPIVGLTDLKTVRPDLEREWHNVKNNGLTPEQFTYGSGKKVWWQCGECGNEWQATIANRVAGKGCPVCSKKKRGLSKVENLVNKVGSFAEHYPLLSKEWHYRKNGSYLPSMVTPCSGKKVWWICASGHEWQATIANRIKGQGCPFCSGHLAVKGENDLQTVNPILAREWHYEKNRGLTPENVLPNSNKKVWWRCRKGHEWYASIASRNSGTGCPICSSERNTSFPEYAILYYLEKYGVDALHAFSGNGYELDVYIPALSIAIEYDGYYWHKNKVTRDLEKNGKCKKDGITLYRIREGLDSLNDSSIDYLIHKNQKDFPQILAILLNKITGYNIDVDLARDNIAIENLREFTEKENSLLYINPKIATEWHYEKNGKLKPEHFSPNSNKKVWWKCSKGHEWQTMINSRKNGTGCPYCSGRYAIKGESDLQTVNPSLAAEWNYEKNDGLTPEDVLPNSNKKVWWRCNNNHEYQSTVHNRSYGYGCPYCSGRYVLKGKNDLQTINLSLAAEWNYEKNDGLTPEDVLPNSNKKVWWKCRQGHEWKAMINSRNKGHSCPYCSGLYPVVGKSDLETLNPIIAQEWNYEKNEDLTPASVTPNSGKKVWWKCSKGHEWQARIADRNRGRGCPECAKENRKKAKQIL